jgi:hypothetical protein
MPEITLTQEQVTLLDELLDITLRDLSYEIADTSLREFKDELKGKRELLEDVRCSLVEAGGD